MNEKLKSYEITGSRKIDNGEIFSVKTEFLNGAIYNMEFTVSYIDNKLMVSNMNRISIVNEGKYILTPRFRLKFVHGMMNYDNKLETLLDMF